MHSLFLQRWLSYLCEQVFKNGYNYCTAVNNIGRGNNSLHVHSYQRDVCNLVKLFGWFEIFKRASVLSHALLSTIQNEPLDLCWISIFNKANEKDVSIMNHSNETHSPAEKLSATVFFLIHSLIDRPLGSFRYIRKLISQ